MWNNSFIFILALFLVIKGATLATRYAARLAENFHLSKYTVGFIIVAVISILPETFISMNAAIEGVPAFALGMLFGANVADLTLLFAAVVFLVGRGLKIESKVLKNSGGYPLLLLLPLVLGFDGYFSRMEGTALIIAGGVFYYAAFKNGFADAAVSKTPERRLRNSILLVLSMAVMLVGAHFTVTSATALAGILGIKPFLIGMLVVGLGTTMPEFFFSLKAAQKRDDSLAVGDILGTVLADATIVVGLLALVSPFAFPKRVIYVTGGFMVAAAYMLLSFMRSGRTLSKKESYLLLAFWMVFILTELIINQ